MFFPYVSSFLFVFDSFFVLCFYINIVVNSIAPVHTFGGFVQSYHIVVLGNFFSFGCKCLEILPLVFPIAPFDFFVFLSMLSRTSLLQALRGSTQHSLLIFSPPCNFDPSCSLIHSSLRFFRYPRITLPVFLSTQLNSLIAISASFLSASNRFASLIANFFWTSGF